MNVAATSPAPSPAPPSPWLADDAFPEAPPATYGYRRAKQLVPCSFEELDAAVRTDLNRQIALVWTPLQARLTPPEEVPFLAEAITEGERRRSWQGLRLAALHLLVWGLFVAFVLFGSRREAPPVYVLYLVSFGCVPLVQNGWTLWQLRTSRWSPASPADGRFRAWIASRQERWSLFILVCLAVVGVVQLYLGVAHLLDDAWSTVANAGLVKPAVWQGELWRLMTGPLLHGNPVHFIFNAIALLVLGGLVETLVSRHLMAVSFVLSVLVGSLFSLLLLDAPSVGASGGIMGLLGVSIALGVRRRGQLPALLLRTTLIAAALIALTGVLAFAVVDNPAHLGGLLAGLGLGYALIPTTGPIPTGTRVPLQRAGWLALAVVVLFSVIALLAMLRVVPWP